MRKLKWSIIFVLVIFSANAYSKETQFNCSFQKEIKLKVLTPLDAVVSQPIFSDSSVAHEFAFFVNSKSGSASYINFSHKIKRPMLIVSKSIGNITLVEDTTSDNRFIVTLFLEKKEGSYIPIVMNTHAWNPDFAPDIYTPKMSIGSCIQSN
jgi:hypothetical protein